LILQAFEIQVNYLYHSWAFVGRIGLMQLLNQISEDEVIAEFLIAEVNSKRFRNSIVSALGNTDIKIILKPDLNNKEQNQSRKLLLGDVRGFGQNKKLFENFPSVVTWYRAIFSREDLSSVLYINYSYWNELSSNTRLPVDAAKKILSDIKIFNVSNEGFKEINSEIKQGKAFPKMIFVSCNETSRIVVLEGHARLTAYFLDSQFIPPDIEVFIGYSDDFKKWNLY
jgi:hypothetical protein